MRREAIQQAYTNTLILAAFTLIAMGLSLRLAWRKHQVDLIQEAYRMATEEGNEGFYICRAVYDRNDTIVDFEIVDCNQSGAKFYSKQREDLLGRRVSELYAGIRRDRVMNRFILAMERGVFEDDIDVPGQVPDVPRWFHLKIVRSGDALAITMRDVTESRAHVLALERKGNEDALTSLPNRHWFNTYLPEAIKQAATSQSMLALLFIDLDGFKTVNDTMGHDAGDELLRNAGRRLKLAVRPNDNVVRIGGDEFVVIVENMMHKDDAAHVAERVLRAFQEGFKLSKGNFSVGTSIGISVYPVDGADAETLLRHADIAMYSVKTTGKRNYRFFDRKFYEAVRARHDTESELRYALEHDQLVLYYQPRVDISTGATCSMEALVRWAHPTKGLIEPLEFVPLAEETGLIVRLGEVVIDKVCAQLAYWAERGQELIPVSINISPRQFNEANVAAVLSAALTRHNIDPGLVEIELTESSMTGNTEEVAESLNAIQRMGVNLSVDDFGTGYSSLSQLQRLDFDVLKVDRAFTADLGKTKEGTVFFSAIITMAHALGMRVVAEGVETMDQIRQLKELRCDEVQGFYISRPLPPADSQPVLPKWFFPSIA
jgi:diguanylate cyclase (GGDEF)-like protein